MNTNLIIKKSTSLYSLLGTCSPKVRKRILAKSPKKHLLERFLEVFLEDLDEEAKKIRTIRIKGNFLYIDRSLIQQELLDALQETALMLPLIGERFNKKTYDEFVNYTLGYVEKNALKLIRRRKEKCFSEVEIEL